MTLGKHSNEGPNGLDFFVFLPTIIGKLYLALLNDVSGFLRIKLYVKKYKNAATTPGKIDLRLVSVQP
jgi:hypothetical protein